MNNTFRYAAISSKLKVRKRAFLSKEDYENVIRFNNITQMTQFLKDRVDFKEGFQDISNANIHRGDLEIILHRYEVSEVEKIINYFSGHYREFFKIMLIEYEILDLQLILQTIAKNIDLTYIKNHFVHSKKYSKLNYDELLGAKTVPQFVDQLRGSIYYAPLKTLTQEDAVRREFHMEMKLYVLYYKELMKKANKLSPVDSHIATNMIGILIDCINIQWIYRATKYYQISPEEILIYVLPEGDKISFKKLKKLCYTHSIDEFKSKAQKYLAYPIFKEEDDTLLERTIDRYLYTHYLKNTDSKNIGICLGYIYELLLQVKELIRITECIRYGYTEEQKIKYLVRTIEDGGRINGN